MKNIYGIIEDIVISRTIQGLESTNLILSPECSKELKELINHEFKTKIKILKTITIGGKTLIVSGSQYISSASTKLEKLQKSSSIEIY